MNIQEIVERLREKKLSGVEWKSLPKEWQRVPLIRLSDAEQILRELRPQDEKEKK